GPERYDLIFDLRPGLVRVQCKWASLRGDVIAVRVVSSRRTADGIAKRSYAADEIDAFAAYCPELDACFFLPISRFDQTRAIQLRIGPCRNGQMSAVNWASEFAFDATLPSHAGP
ncbi:MAG: group I intron-associated PD-(D/E)XK endonuclease, partial [Gaiella sp.]